MRINKYRTGFSCFAITLFVVSLFSQTSEIDNLYSELPTKRDTNRIIKLRGITKIAFDSDLKRARTLVQEQVDIAEELEESTYIAEANNSFGIYYYYVGEIDSAIIKFEASLDKFKEIGAQDRLSSLYNNLGSMATQKGDFQSAIAYHLQSLSLKEETKDTAGISGSHYNIGNTWINLDQYKEAQENFEKARALSNSIGDRYSEGECIEALAVVEDAYERHREGLILHKEALEIAREFKDYYQEAIILGNIGSSYSVLGNCDTSLIYLEEARALSIEIGNYNGLGYIERSMGECYGKLGYHKKSIQMLNSVIERNKEQGLDEVLSDDYNYLYTEYKRVGNYKQALYALEDHMNLRDSTRGVQTEQMVRDLNTKYESEKKDAEIKLLNKQTELDATRKKALWGGIGLLSLLAGGIIYGQTQRRKRIQEAAIKDKQIEIEKRQQAERELEYKKKELTAKVLQLASKNEFLQSLEEEVGALQSSVDTSITKTSQKISRMIHNDALDDKEWDQFSKEFSSIHQNFMDRLISQYGDFSNHEWRLISLLKMNLSSKDIANTLRITPNGVKKARYRLRKKMKIESEVDIQDYLLSY